MKNWSIQFINGYQKFFSPFFGGDCRFYPSCSEYAKESISNGPFLKGIFKSFHRILKCHPWHPGGVDLP